MSKVYFFSDLHLGHKRILEFSGDYRGGGTIDEHDTWVINQINSVVNKRDTLWLLGDLAFTREALYRLSEIKGYKKIILGNHDGFPIEEYMKFGRVYPGIVKYNKHWLSHAPVHPTELRGCPNIHGHVHHNTLPDNRYYNVSVENYKVPMTIQQLKETK